MTVTEAGSSAEVEADRLALLRQWLQITDGGLSGEFLRWHDLNPSALVALGYLRVGPGRWSDSFVAGPRLESAPPNQRTSTAV